MSFRLTISQRLWLGLGLILALFGAAHFVSVRATHTLDAALSGVVEDSEARNAAAYEMQIGLERMTRAALAVPEAAGPAQRKQLGDAQAGFQRTLSNYTALASTARSLKRAIDVRYARYNERVSALVEQADAHSHHLAAYEAHRRQGQALLQTLPRAWVARETPPPQAGAAARSLGRYLRDAGTVTPGREGADRSPGTGGSRRRLDAALSSYEAFARTAAERTWVASARRWLSRGDHQARAIVASEQAQRRVLAELIEQRDALDRLFRERIQPAARAELNQAVARASETAHDANLLVTRGLILALALGVLVAVATTGR
jgi:hypothetical protein